MESIELKVHMLKYQVKQVKHPVSSLSGNISLSLFISPPFTRTFFSFVFFFFRSVGNNEKEANCESRLTVSRLHVQVEDTPGSKCELFLS